MLRGILEDVQKPALERLRILVHTFIRSECDEAKVRGALNDAAPLYRDAPEAHGAWASGDRTVNIFMREALPEASEATRALAGNLITTTLSAVGKHFSESPRTPAEIEAYAEAMAECFEPTLKVSRIARTGAAGVLTNRKAEPGATPANFSPGSSGRTTCLFPFAGRTWLTRPAASVIWLQKFL